MTPERRAWIEKLCDLTEPDVLVRSIRELIAELDAVTRERDTERDGWRCFHCGEMFYASWDARDHFGVDQSNDPACRIKIGAERGLVAALRKSEAELARYTALLHDENLEAYRMLAEARSQHSAQLRAAEELGYERGLSDGMAVQHA